MIRKITGMSLVIAMTLGLAAVSCGGDSDKELLIGDFAQAYSAEFCSKLYTCCDEGELADLQGTSYSDEASCTTYFAGLTQQYIVSNMQAAITAGRGEYNAKTAASCLDAYMDRGCVGAAQNDLSALQGACEDFYVGLQVTDGECDNALECSDGHYCADGVCTLFAVEDAECVAGETICEADLFCDGSNCVPRLADSTQCVSDSQFVVYSHCQSGLVCDVTAGECAQPVIDEQICDGQ